MSHNPNEPDTNSLEDDQPVREADTDDTLTDDELVDEQIDESFPASDPPASY